MIKKILCILLIFNLTACSNISNLNNMYNGLERDKIASKIAIKESEAVPDNPDKPENIRVFTKTKDEKISLQNIESNNSTNKNIIDNNDYITIVIDDISQRITYGELIEILQNYLTNTYNNYNIKEHLVYNYVLTDEKNQTGIYITEDLQQKRDNLQFFNIDEKTTNASYLKEITAIQYKNKNNGEYYIGRFKTKQKNKNVKLEWEESNSENEEVNKLTALKNINFLGLTNLYEFNNTSDFSGKGEMSLKDWKNNILQIKNSGTDTLRNIEATPIRNITKDGINIEEQLTIRPLDFKFAYDIKVKDNTIIMTADLTTVLKSYYKLFANLDIVNANYSMEIERLNDEEIDMYNISTDSNITE